MISIVHACTVTEMSVLPVRAGGAVHTRIRRTEIRERLTSVHNIRTPLLSPQILQLGRDRVDLNAKKAV